MKKRWLAALTAAIIVLGISAAPMGAGASSADSPITLKEEQTIPDPERELKTTTTNGLFFKTKGDAKVLCDENGKEIPTVIFSSAEHLTGDVWILHRQGPEVPENCVVKTDGTVLIPWGLTVIDVRNEHYLSVITGKETTENKEEALMYLSPNRFTMGIPGDKDVLYKGTLQLYDLDGGKMLDDVVLTNNSQSFTVIGTSYKANDKVNTPRILDASGTVLMEDASRCNTEGGYYYMYDGEKKKILDDKLNTVAITEKGHVAMEGGYLSYHDDKQLYGVKSFDGKILVKAVSVGSVRKLSGDFFVISGKDALGKRVYGLVDMNGKTVLPTKYYTISDLHNGYCYALETQGDKKCTLIAPDGRIISDKVDGYPDSRLCEEVEKGKYIILNTGKILDLSSKQISQMGKIGTGLLTLYDSDKKKYGLYELFDGKQILACEWDKIMTAYDRIYAYKDGSWHVFSY